MTHSSTKKPPTRRRIALAAALALAGGWAVWHATEPYREGLKDEAREQRLAAAAMKMADLIEKPGGPGGPGDGAPGPSALAMFQPEDGTPTFRQQLAMARELNLTPEQALKMRRIRGETPPGSMEELAERLAEYEKILAPEQMELIRGRAREFFRRRFEVAKTSLPPGEFAIFEARFQTKMKEAGLNLGTPPRGAR